MPIALSAVGRQRNRVLFSVASIDGTGPGGRAIRSTKENNKSVQPEQRRRSDARERMVSIQMREVETIPPYVPVQKRGCKPASFAHVTRLS